MGPPPFSGGERARAGLLRAPRSGCFNGAAAFQRRRVHLPVLALHHRGQASMGPPPFSGGEKRALLSSSAAKSVLQWGRRLSAAESSTTRRGPELASSPCFNG